MRGRALTAALVGALAVALMIAAPAAALERGVFVDPGSPAGKEYSFPLSVLRGAATGYAAPDGVSQPLFGVGIHPPGSRRGARRPYPGGGAHGAFGARHAPHAVSPRPQTKTNSPGSPASKPPQLESLIRPSSGVPLVGLITFLLLLTALAAGAGIAALRRRS